VIFGSFLVSNDHCYILLNVADHFEFRVLYVHTLFSILLRIKVSLQSVKNLLVYPGSSGPRPDHPATLGQSALVSSGWSGPCPDHPALGARLYIGPSHRLALAHLTSFNADAPLLLQTTRGDLQTRPRIREALLPLWFPTHWKTGTSPELLDSCGKTQRYFIQNSYRLIYQCRRF